MDEPLTDAEIATLAAHGYEPSAAVWAEDRTLYVRFKKDGHILACTRDFWRELIAELTAPQRAAYIVCGTSGSRMNENLANWNVCAYDTESAAHCHVERAQRRADRIARAQRLWRDLRNEVATKHFNRWGDYTGRNPYDPWMQFNGGVRYFVDALPLCTAVRRLTAAEN